MNRRWLLFTLVATAVIAGGVFWRQQYPAARRLLAWNEHLQDEAILAVLNKPVELPHGKIPLPAFAQTISQATGIEVVIDDDMVFFKPGPDPFAVPTSVNNAHTSEYTPKIDIGYSQLPAVSHLSLALQQLDLCWFIRRGQIVIATPEVAANQPLLVATYLLPQSAMAEPQADSTDWAQLVTHVIEPNGWDDVGGQGHCEPVPGALVVAHRPEIHRQIRALLAAMRAQDAPPRSWRPVPIGPAPVDQSGTAIIARLQQPASIDCNDVSLGELVDSLAAEHKIPIVLNLKKLEESSVSRDSPLTLKLSGLSLGSLLNHIVRQLELTWLVRDGVVQITTPEDAESQLLLVAYPVHDLAAVPPFNPHDPRSRDLDSIIELITSAIRPDAWGDFSGPGPIDSIGGWLLIPQTQPIHADIERLLQDLRRALALGDTPTLFAQPKKWSAEARILAALDQPIELSYSAAPLSRVCEVIGKTLKIPVTLFRKKFDEASVKIDLPVSCEFSSASARLQLKRLLEPHNLAFSVRDEALVITTIEDAESSLITRVYDVRSMFETDVALFSTADHDRLIEIIRDHLHTASWNYTGGPGEIDCFRGLLVVSQSSEVHHEITAFLGELRRAMHWRKNRAVMPSTLPSSEEQRLLAALKLEIALDYDGVPLTEVCRDLSRQLGVPIRWDASRSPLSGFHPDPTITFHFPRAPANDQLVRLSAMLELELDVRAGVLTFDKPDECFTRQTRIYDVRSLVNDSLTEFTTPSSSMTTTSRTLCESLMARVAPNTWHPLGLCRIDYLQGFLIVSHTCQNLASLESLLDELRHATVAPPLP